ncbi:MAG: hypothetical protein ACI3XI_03800 [Eubacteriales bacterium]
MYRRESEVQMSETKQDTGVLEVLADSGRIGSALCEYLEFCAKGVGAGREKQTGRIPNAAGFCRFAGATLNDLERLKRSRPEAYEAVSAVLEDEALNSSLSATVLSAYLKARLGYSGEKSEESSVTDTGQIRLIFDHDAYKDGE